MLFVESSSVTAKESWVVNVTQRSQTSLPNSTPADAEKLFQEGKQLYEQGTAESLLQAIAKFEAVLPLYRKLGDRSSEAFTLGHLGKIYSDLGQQKKALDYLNQTLSLRRQIGDKKDKRLL